MNAALKFIHGEYVIFLNCGDRLYAKDVLEKSVRFMQKKAADIYYGKSAIIIFVIIYLCRCIFGQ